MMAKPTNKAPQKREFPYESPQLRGATLKDDCFGPPEPGDPGYKEFMATMKRFDERSAKGEIRKHKLGQ